MIKFDLQRFAAVLPDNPTAAMATVGKDYLLYVNTGTAYVPVWTLVGGQRGASLGMTAEEIDASSKTTGGWTATLPGMRSWNIDLDGLMLLQDAGIEALERAHAQGKQVNVKFRYPDDSYRVGWATLTDFSSEAPHDGEATLSGTLSGNGPLSSISKTVSKAAAIDLTFYFESKAKATSVTEAGVAVDPAKYVATGYGEITFDGEYLATLTAGEHLFCVNLSIGGSALVALVVTA
jgi:TP901-1 family phage major tail protein